MSGSSFSPHRTRRPDSDKSRDELLGELHALRTRTGERLEDLEARCRTALEITSDGFWTWNVAHDRFRPNAGLLVMLGYREGELFDGREAWLSLVHRDDRAAVGASIADHLEGRAEASFSEHRMLSRDGRWRWISERGKVVSRDPEGSPLLMVGSCRDVTEEKTITAELRASEARLRETQRLAHLGIWEVGFPEGDAYASEEALLILGLDPARGAPSYRAFLEFVHDRDRDRVTASALGSIESGDAFQLLFRIVRPDGEVRWVESVGRPVRGSRGEVKLVATLVDVTDRREAESAMRRSERRFSALLESAAQGIVAVGRDGKIAFANATLEKMFGYQVNEILGKPVELLLPSSLGEGHSRHRAEYFDAPRSRPMGLGMDLVARRRDGTEFPVEVSLSYLEEDEQPLAVAFINDISPRKRAAAEKEKLEEQLRHAVKMEAVGRLAGGIAHDFNNMLSALSGFSEIALEVLDHDHPLREGALGTYEMCQRSAALVRQLLAVSRRQMLQPTRLNLNDVIRELQRMLTGLVGGNVKIVSDMDPALPAVEADRSQLEQVILNLVVNAKDAMPRGGTVTIRTSAAERSDGAKGARPYVKLEVIDTGHGMDPDTMSRIFEPFFTTKPGKGTGLGLATVFGIIEQSGGQIEARSTPGDGASFTIWLPASDGAVEPNPPRAPGPPRSAGSETVLLVEDEPAVRFMVREALKREGYRVLEAADGVEALAVVAESREPIHLVLTDVVLPGMSGPRLAARLSQSHPHLPFVFMSGQSDDVEALQEASRQGFQLLEKPFTREQLALKIRRALEP
jgi:hypothetical protein